MHPLTHQPVLAPRLTRTFMQTIHASPDRVFPLLCPEMETRWLDDWRYRMIHSASGVAEPGAVFETPHPAGRTLWVVTHHEPHSRVAFVRWQPDDLLVDINIQLTPLASPDGKAIHTRVDIRYCWTGTGPAAGKVLAALTEQSWRNNMTHWERSMNAWLAEHASAAVEH